MSRSTPATDKKRRRKRRGGRGNSVNGYVPVDVVELILMRMNPKDAVRLSTVCKDWRATAARYDPTMSTTPWLLTMTLSNTTCRLQNVVDKEVSFKIKLHGFQLRKTYCCGSWHGWLVLQPNRDDPISLLNPFSRQRLDLPAGGPASGLFLYMSSAPTIPGCVLFARDRRDLYVWRPGHVTWTVENVNLGDFDSIVGFRGQFYALNDDGSLLSFQVFPLRLTKLDVPPPIDNIFGNRRFLVESCGEILFVGMARHHSSSISVLRLDLKNKAWVKMERLGDQALFLNRKQAISVSAVEAGCDGDRIYFSNPCDDDVIWRVSDMESRRLDSFPRTGRRHRRFRDQVWITPSLS
ncbi:hypothetical protein BHE74_00010992 [Ensete ventricosum]|nr:hypothetical protein GW17_00011818 [Ensete ventricosum]RWW80664.1 hypothetical protein BHE74_00010992 [Ensete ventricosum]RZR83976.1 hypothetical protein BHM03_00010702 [Ensete ventricosum]